MKVESKQARKKSASEGDGLLDQFFDHWREFVEEHSRVSLCCWGSTLTVAFVLRCWQQPTKNLPALKMGDRLTSRLMVYNAN